MHRSDNLTIGRIVWYRHDEWEPGACSPAIVTFVHAASPAVLVDLVVFFRGYGARPVANVRRGAGDGQWRWPDVETYRT